VKVTASTRFQLRLAGASFIALVVFIAAVLMWLSTLYRAEFDLTRSGRNSLSPASIEVLKRLTEPLRVTGFASPQDEHRVDVAKLLKAYQRYKGDIVVEWVDPDTDPERTRKAGVRYQGELVLRYGDASENVSQPSEEAITNALVRLGHRGERWVVFLDGHGERHPDRQANFDLSRWVEQLRRHGFQTRALSLAESPQIPQNTSVLVIAGPQTRLLAGEVRTLRQYLDDGGNLLWLTDPGLNDGLGALAEQLGVEIEPGVVVDPLSQALTGSPTAVVISKYGTHPAVQHFHDNTVFPVACGLNLATPDAPPKRGADTKPEWESSVLVDTRPTSWSETDLRGTEPNYDRGRDAPGPLNIAVAFSRASETREQRVIMVCDGDFLSNTFVMSNGGNLDFGMNLINWVSHDDAYIDVPSRTVVDRALDMSAPVRTGLTLFFAVLLPLGLSGGGIAIWWRRRKR
jgi:ABC-type uncharacterized transport system involved in gliding motility auxiliary subunit